MSWVSHILSAHWNCHGKESGGRVYKFCLSVLLAVCNCWVMLTNFDTAQLHLGEARLVSRITETVRSIVTWSISLCLYFLYSFAFFNECTAVDACNRWSSEIQGTALGKCQQAWPGYIYQSMPAGVAQSRHTCVGGTVSTWGRWRIPVNKRQKRHQKCRSSTHCSWGMCRSDSRFPQLVV